MKSTLRLAPLVVAILMLGCRSVVLHVDPGSWGVLRSGDGSLIWLTYTFECEPRLECHFGYGQPPLIYGLRNENGDFSAAAEMVCDEERGRNLWGPKRSRRYQARFRLDRVGNIDEVLGWKEAFFVLEDGMIFGDNLLYREAVDIGLIRRLLKDG